MTTKLPDSVTIGIVVGETSGDILGTNLMVALKKKLPTVHFVGIVGPGMQAEGAETWYQMEELAVMGIVEILGRIRRLLSIRRDVKKRFITLQPDVFIGIDAPDFNLTLEEKLKRAGIKTVHYVSPSVWAWREKRVFKIARATDLVLAFLPFEKAFYDKFGVPCRFIGHTMADAIPITPDKSAARKVLKIDSSALCLAILPGSRGSEIEMLSEIFLRAALHLFKQFPNLVILVPLVNQKRREEFERIKQEIAPNLPMRLIDGQARDVMIASNAALVASGTATLECMLAKCPMVVGYRLKPLTYWLVKRLMKSPFVALPNLLAGEEITREFIQKECEPEKLAAELQPLLAQPEKAYPMIQKFTELHRLIRCDADNQAADAVIELLNQ